MGHQVYCDGEFDHSRWGHEARLSSRRSLIGCRQPELLNQTNALLLAGTVHDNITCGRADVSREQVIAAAQRAKAEDENAPKDTKSGSES